VQQAHRFCDSGGFVLCRHIWTRWKFSSQKKSLVLKLPAIAKPETVVRNLV